jgi:hypothetical protein
MAESIEERMLERLWGDEVVQISPEVRKIILSALRKARERRERMIQGDRIEPLKPRLQLSS